MIYAITMRNELNPVYVQTDSGGSLLDSMNMAAATGKEFIVAPDAEGHEVMIHVPNVNTMRKISDDDALFTG